MNKILLSFDIEEFDIAKEYGISISREKENEISLLGAMEILPLLAKYSISATFFITAEFANNNNEIVSEIAQKHEVASHSLNHSSYSIGDMLQSKISLEEITGKRVSGFRMPRLQSIDYQELGQAGYRYDSSINPTLIPFRYNHLNKPIIPYRVDNIIVLPVSVTPVFRIPLFWLSLKNFPLDFYIFMAKRTLERTGYLSIYFHCWEFMDIGDMRLPFYIKRNSGLMMGRRLISLIDGLLDNQKTEFVTNGQYVEEKSIIISVD